ncbi:MAG: adenylate/guanylate cyclase domain-containing protein [Elusimicrobiota bacterium]|jgi:class 3 adenylate cyclase
MAAPRKFLGIELTFRSSGKHPESGFHYLLVLPCFLVGIDTAFTHFFYLAVGVGASKEALARVMGYGADTMPRLWSLSTLCLYVPILAWYWPIRKYIQTHDERLRDKVRRRLANLLPAMLWLFGLVLVIRVGTHLLQFRSVLDPGLFWKYNLPAMLLSVASQFCFAGIMLSNTVGTAGGPLYDRLYTKEELQVSRGGRDLPLVWKIAILILSTAVIPLIMVYLSLRSLHGVGGFELQALNNLVINSMAALFVGIGVLLGTLQRPIDGLIAKMRRLAGGDFDVKTRVYFGDEVAQLKANFNRMVDQLREREALRETFGKYVSVEVARKLMASKGADLGGEEIEATVLFCDIRNFTPMSERMTARQVVDFLNEYFSFVTKPIMEHHGVINKFMGDAVMAVYAPILGSQDHVADALRSAQGMREALTAFNASGKYPGETRFGIGIQTGALVAGNVGTLARLEYTVIGDTVNVASRLESATKEVGVDILVGEDVYRRAKEAFGEAAFRGVGEVSIKGKSAPLRLYAVQ